MSSDAPEFEPELYELPPRKLRSTWRERFGRWTFFTLVVLVPGVLFVCGVVAHKNWQALRDHGVETVGRVTQKEPRKKGKNGHGPRIAVEYRVDEQVHVLWDSITDEEYPAVRIDQPHAVVYLPEKPGTAQLAAELAGGGSSSAGGLIGGGVILALILAPFWIYVELTFRRVRRLARDGIPTRATSVEQLRRMRAKGMESWRLRYEFTAGGQTHSRVTWADVQVATGLVGPEGKATVLFDPTNPARSELYPVVAKLYRIVPAASTV